MLQRRLAESSTGPYRRDRKDPQHVFYCRSLGPGVRLHLCAILLIAGWTAYVFSTPALSRQVLPRVALVGFSHPSSAESTEISRRIEARLNSLVAANPRVSLVDQSIVRPALSGLKYNGSINMSRDEARRVGSAIGCDFFITGKIETVTRSEKKGELHEEVYAGVMIVDGRTGDLTAFDFISEKATTREVAATAVENSIVERVPGYIDRIINIRAALRATLSTPQTSSVASEIIEDLPAEDSPRAVGFKPPTFLNRIKPDFTVEAEQADITATVDAMVVFHANGEVGSVEITRWAGFGLDESAAASIRQLKYTPALREGKPTSVRAMIRYNFRRINEASHQPEGPAPEPPGDKPSDKPSDKPGRDLRPIFKPTYRRP